MWVAAACKATPKPHNRATQSRMHTNALNDTGKLWAELWKVHERVAALHQMLDSALEGVVPPPPPPQPPKLLRKPNPRWNLSLSAARLRWSLNRSDAEDVSSGCCGRAGWEVATTLQQQRVRYSDGPDLFHFHCCAADAWRDAEGLWRPHGYKGTALKWNGTTVPMTAPSGGSGWVSTFLDTLDGQVLLLSGDSLASQFWMALVCFFARHSTWGRSPTAVDGELDESAGTSY